MAYKKESPITFKVTKEQKPDCIDACEKAGVSMASKARELFLNWVYDPKRQDGEA